MQRSLWGIAGSQRIPQRIDALMKRCRFERMLAMLHGAKEGRPAYRPLGMLKALCGSNGRLV